VQRQIATACFDSGTVTQGIISFYSYKACHGPPANGATAAMQGPLSGHPSRVRCAANRAGTQGRLIDIGRRLLERSLADGAVASHLDHATSAAHSVALTVRSFYSSHRQRGLSLPTISSAAR